jgi:hypothetical protein
MSCRLSVETPLCVCARACARALCRRAQPCSSNSQFHLFLTAQHDSHCPTLKHLNISKPQCPAIGRVLYPEKQEAAQANRRKRFPLLPVLLPCAWRRYRGCLFKLSSVVLCRAIRSVRHVFVGTRMAFVRRLASLPHNAQMLTDSPVFSHSTPRASVLWEGLTIGDRYPLALILAIY